MTLGILNCDLDEDPNTNGAMLLQKHLLKLASLQPIFIWKIWNNEFPSHQHILQCKAIFITGSSAHAYAAEEWILRLQNLLRELPDTLPVLGICFGAQLIAQTFGGKVVASGSYEEGFKEVVLENTPLFSEISPPFKVYQSHGDAIISLPKGAEEIARNSFSLQGFVYKNFCAVQFHPEILPETAKVMALRDGRAVSEMLGEVSESYDLSLKVVRNFLSFRNNT